MNIGHNVIYILHYTVFNIMIDHSPFSRALPVLFFVGINGGLSGLGCLPDYRTKASTFS